MTARDKFRAAMSFESPAVTLKTEFGYWAGAIRRWLKEGLPELARVLPLVERGGYVPHIDHAVPADISRESFRYYRERLNEIIDAGAFTPRARRTR